MLIIRPIRTNDYEALYQISVTSGHGFTSLPVNEGLLKSKIAHAEASFSKHVEAPSGESYLMVLEDLKTNEVVGTCGIESVVGREDAFCHYRLGTEIYHSEQTSVYNEVETLTLCDDYTGASELCTLFLNKEYRGGDNGSMLSRSRFLFLAQHEQRFGNTVIAEMRGVSDKEGGSPFYEWLQDHFLGIDFVQADYLSGVGKKASVVEMIPKSPIHVCLLPKKAQKVIGDVHHNTKPALKLLYAEGFKFTHYVDVFDGGATVECAFKDIRSVNQSRILTVTVGKMPPAKQQYVIANTLVADYRATKAKILVSEDKNHNNVTLSPQLAEALKVTSGQQIRVLKL